MMKKCCDNILSQFYFSLHHFNVIKLCCLSYLYSPELSEHEKAAIFLDAFSGTDFTVNAVYYDIETKKLFDPLGVAFKDYRTSNLRLSNFMDKSKGLVKFRSSLIRMIRLASEMNFKVDPELLNIAEED
jgi:hypothetical protein